MVTPEILYLNDLFNTLPEENPPAYQIYAIVFHTGAHYYTCTRKPSSEQWLVHDDDKLAKEMENLKKVFAYTSAMSAKPTLLLYYSQESEDKRSEIRVIHD